MLLEEGSLNVGHPPRALRSSPSVDDAEMPERAAMDAVIVITMETRGMQMPFASSVAVVDSEPGSYMIKGALDKLDPESHR